jgi:uncharacterized membrane protein
LKKNKAIGYAEQVLLILNMIIIFLLIFEDRLVIPYWLQPAGRMHPLLLHFPIAFLTLSMVAGIYRFTQSGERSDVFLDAERGLLLAGTLLTGITLIMGLFLSREGGYSGDTLTWHKWAGVFVFFLASVLYLLAFRKGFKAPAAWVSALLMMGALVATGHYGAGLSHGEDFLMEPIIAHREARVVPLEQAVVFADVIQPILEKKCAGCHNTHKLKGELVLTDSTSLRKGGKSGKLFIPGNPDTSLLMERLHLSMEEEKHMPPAGKPQLTKEEIMLLASWIKADADFHVKVTGLDIDDSLRVLATTWLQRTSDAGEQYAFPAADPKTIQKLNTDYRSILTIAKVSPALEVNIYNRSTYTPVQLKELEGINKQVVSLNLNKMPVKDDDLKLVGGFENLRRLDLNFSDITDKGLEALKPLKHLRSLSLAGTGITYKGLGKIIGYFKDLSSVTLWQTAVTPQEMDQLKKDNRSITVNEGFRDEGKNKLKLNPPQIANPTTVFSDDIPVLLRHPVRGVQVRFTTDGTEPDSVRSPVFDGKTIVNKTTTVKAKAYKEGWYSSDVVMFDYLKNAHVPDSVRLLLPLNSVHQAEGAHTFFNKRLGVIGANNPAWANNWAGVQKNDLVLVSLFNEPVTLGSVGLHYMLEEKTGIYPPALVEVWGGENEKKARLLLTMKPPLPKKGGDPELKLLEGKFTPRSIGYLRIIAKPHSNKKDHHLLLVDEMILN